MGWDSTATGHAREITYRASPLIMPPPAAVLQRAHVMAHW